MSQTRMKLHSRSRDRAASSMARKPWRVSPEVPETPSSTNSARTAKPCSSA
ncbi:MAG: hypothetical protein ABIK96_12750 [bacterium]